MLTFRKLELSDKEIIRPYLLKKNSQAADYTEGGLFIWKDYENTYFCIENGVLYVRSQLPDEEPIFYIPFCEHPEEKETYTDIQIDWCIRNGYRPLFYPVEGDDLAFVREKYEILDDIPRRRSFDYLYHAEELAVFPGKRFAGQRNHVNKFKKTYSDWTFEKIDRNNISEAVDLCTEFERKSTKETKIAREDMDKELEILGKFDVYGFTGAILKVSGKTVGFTVGEVKNDTLYIHFEKANRNYEGVYQMVVSQFASMMLTPEIRYINREDDADDEGLRTSKLSYHPCGMVEKHAILIGKKK